MLDRNKQNQGRLTVLRNHVKELRAIEDLTNLEKLKQIAKKGDNIELWQEYIGDLEKTKNGDKGNQSTLKMTADHMEFLSNVAKNNVDITTEFKDI